MNKIEINPLTNDIQADIEMMQADIDSEGYHVTVGTANGKIVLTSDGSDLKNMVSEENFRECYLNGCTVKQAIAKIRHWSPSNPIDNRSPSDGPELTFSPQIFWRTHMATKTKTARKITIKGAMQQIATGAKSSKLYAGSPIQATRLFMRPMDEYTNCTAVCYMALNETTGVVTYCNAYGAKGSDASEAMPRSSYDKDTYTYPIKQAIVAKKMDTMIELERPELWPSFVTLAHVETKPAPRRGRKAAAK